MILARVIESIDRRAAGRGRVAAVAAAAQVHKSDIGATKVEEEAAIGAFTLQGVMYCLMPESGVQTIDGDRLSFYVILSRCCAKYCAK